MPFDTGRGYRRVERIASAFEARGLEALTDSPEVARSTGGNPAGLAGAARVVLEGAGHASNVDRPGAFNQAVPDFLQGL